MARKRKKKSLSQQIVGVATTGMPQPVKKVLGGRFVAAVIVVAISILFAIGVVTIRWENGRPKLSINRQRAEEVKREVSQDVQALRAERSDGRR